MMYVIYVQSGSETAVMYAMRDLGYTAYVPRELHKYRKKGVWNEEIRPLFDGYIFFQTDRLTADDYYTIRKIHGVGNFVSKTTCLSCTEEEYIIGLCRNPDILKVSKGHIENGVLKIDSGYLKRYEHKIVKFSRRQHKAVIEITLYGKPHRITCAVDIDKCSN